MLREPVRRTSKLSPDRRMAVHFLTNDTCPGRGVALWLLSILAWLPVTPAQGADPSALWNIDNGKCVPHMRESNDPSPCVVVNLEAGFVVLKDLVGATQYLLLPTARISGIEDPAVLAPSVPNYWDWAWRMRKLTESRAGKELPREDLSLAVNSPSGRTQDELHIHIDCVRQDVRDALAEHRDAITMDWTSFPVPLAGLPWRTFRIDGRNLGTINPFRLLAKADPDAGADMAHHTLVLVGMTWSNKVEGFALLDGKVDLAAGNLGSGEVLQDHDCALAH
jgi:CDP-diacylglycerol pyrophosphatase